MSELIRNFSIIAHIDHGKTTLTDRILQTTGTIGERDFHERMLDSNPIEQERGITIKLAPVRMEYVLPETLKQTYDQDRCQFNLIDTPGHVDFTYEVSRSLAAGEGALLLVDATQGIQAQTLSNYDKARAEKLTIIPVLNKIDLPAVDLVAAKLELMEVLDFAEEEIMTVSAKTGESVDELLWAIIERVPQPATDTDAPLKALVFSSRYDLHQGVVVYVRVMEGELTVDQLQFMRSGKLFEPQEIGVFSPEKRPIKRLRAGEVGYIATGLKDLSHARVGDTVTAYGATATAALPGYKPPQLMVYMDFYPIEGGDYAQLTDAMDKLSLHDAALEFTPTHSPALGNGLRVGFLGVLHGEIVQERLEREFDLDLIATAPSVRYEVELTDGENIEVHNPTELPEPNVIATIREPMAEVTLLTPQEYLGSILQLCEHHRGEQQEMTYVGERVRLTYLIPLPELVVHFYDELKSASSGYASMEYEVVDYRPVEAVKLSILINKVPVDALSQMVVKDKAEEVGRVMVKRLKEVIPRQLFQIPIQAAIGSKIVARETIKAYRKDVTAKLYGGDRTRRMKLLEKQKKGKERRKQFGKVDIPQEAFMAVLKRD